MVYYYHSKCPWRENVLPMNYPTIEQCIGQTPLVQLQHLPDNGSNTILLKLEGNNPAGSVKDRPALNMIKRAEERGEINRGDSLIEATSGNTGIALAMAAAIRGYHMVLVMPENMSLERRALMRAYGAEIVLTPAEGSMEAAIDKAREMEAAGKGRILDQFSNADNPSAHEDGTGPEIWQQTGGEITHFVSAMGTTGTIMGVSAYFRRKQSSVEIIGVQPADGALIPGIRRWPEEYLPAIYDAGMVDRIMDMGQEEAEETTRKLAAEEGILVGISAGGAVAAALKLSHEVENSVIVVIVSDRGDRYLSTGVFPSE
jgi:cysteine synthase B